MALSKKDFSEYIRQFKFRELFNDMGWNRDNTTQPIAIDNITYTLQGVAEKSGFKILLCNPTEEGNIPDYATRKKIETKVTKLFQEHLIIFMDAKKQEQVWQLVVRQTGKPVKVTETRYNISQNPELLYQRAAGLFFELDEEEKITIVDVKNRVSENFHQNNEKVTKQFYDNFKAEHKSFLEFIKGIEDKVNKDWYASLMLNRLMFCYFIQKKGFLDNNKNYLRDKLKTSQEKRGKDKFYSFYRDFLLHLFHFGLGAPDRNKELTDEIGKIPYLNGGLFDEHELEKNHKSIEINDKAFERIFDFFDQYEWHLDTRKAATGKDINPDVIGYIFEKYINDRAQMGAYYTKEDITDYISKNCIIPFLFNSKDITFDTQALREHGEKYIYPAVKYGVENKLPEEISAGIKDVSKRTDWNKLAPPAYALPTEIWREVIERRNRYNEIKTKIEKGEITAINDFITYNLDIRQFAQDTIENTNNPDVLKAFYKALYSVTILDPTCGSGAFLFAAMNILETLYESCIQRMENFVAEAPKGKFKSFEETLSQVKAPEHPNLQYFIYKSIILRNLYGVDIMKEAVEIAKLRLFLKLVATVEADFLKPNLGLEPLPDIDFNIRSGNTLIGFGTQNELEKGLKWKLDYEGDEDRIKEKCDIVARAYERYKEIQLSHGDDYKKFKEAKEELNTRLRELNNELNPLLHKQYSAIPYSKWLTNYQPFHWFAEFYEIVSENKGFNLIIGNPPYVALKDLDYLPKSYDTTDCGDIYALCIERTLKSLLNSNGRIGMIVPISIASTDGYSSLRKVCSQSKSGFYFSNFGVRPSKLFDGVDKRLTVFISSGKGNEGIYSTKYYRWFSTERDLLFQRISYNLVESNLFAINGFPKVSTKVEREILDSLKKRKTSISNFLLKSTSHKVKYTRKLQYFIQFFEEPPLIKDSRGKTVEPTELKEMNFNNELQKELAIAALNSNLFFWFFITFSDCRNVNAREIIRFPIDLNNFGNEEAKPLKQLARELMKDFKSNAIFQTRNDKRAGLLEIQSFQPRLSKDIIDKIDIVLAEHYGFKAEQLDFIINYEIKYRMGKELDDEE